MADLAVHLRRSVAGRLEMNGGRILRAQRELSSAVARLVFAPGPGGSSLINGAANSQGIFFSLEPSLPQEMPPARVPKTPPLVRRGLVWNANAGNCNHPDRRLRTRIRSA